MKIILRNFNDFYEVILEVPSHLPSPSRRSLSPSKASSSDFSSRIKVQAGDKAHLASSPGFLNLLLFPSATGPLKMFERTFRLQGQFGRLRKMAAVTDGA